MNKFRKASKASFSVVPLMMVLALVVGFAVTMSVLPASAGHVTPTCDPTAAKTIHVKQSTLDDVQGACQSGYITYWQFVIVQIDNEADAPSSIHVMWGNGSTADVTLWKYTGKTAHYQTTDNPGAKVTDATAVIYDCWDANFNLSDVTCGTPTQPVPEWPAITLLCSGILVVGVIIYRSRRNRLAQSK